MCRSLTKQPLNMTDVSEVLLEALKASYYANFQVDTFILAVYKKMLTGFNVQTTHIHLSCESLDEIDSRDLSLSLQVHFKSLKLREMQDAIRRTFIDPLRENSI